MIGTRDKGRLDCELNEIVNPRRWMLGYLGGQCTKRWHVCVLQGIFWNLTPTHPWSTLYYMEKSQNHPIPPIYYLVLLGKILKPPHTTLFITWYYSKKSGNHPTPLKFITWYYSEKSRNHPKPPYLLPCTTWKNPEATLYRYFNTWYYLEKSQNHPIPPFYC